MGEVRAKGEGKTSSKYFDTILNPEVTTQAADSSRRGDVRMEESAVGAGPIATGSLGPNSTDMKSLSPSHETGPIDRADAGSPSYSPPASPPSLLSFATLLNRTDPPATTPSSILSAPTPISNAHHHHHRTVLPLLLHPPAPRAGNSTSTPAKATRSTSSTPVPANSPSSRAAATSSTRPRARARSARGGSES